MSHFIKNGSAWNVAADNALDIHDKLPGGNYIVKKDPFDNLYLETIDSFEVPTKLYGDIVKTANRIYDTFQRRPNNTGVLLNGEKGSGKTQLAKLLGNMCEANDIPCIVINASWRGDKFNKFMQDIEQPCMILFDEFEKVYDREEQTEVLTLLDGVFPSRKLFVLTCNDKYRIDSHMRNRPGRIFYLLDFKGLDAQFIREYCEDTLVNKDHMERLCTITGAFAQFNFDMLKALVEEMNRYNESPSEALAMLNIKPEFSDGELYTYRIVADGKHVDPKNTTDTGEFHGNPLNGVRIHYDPDPADDDGNWVELHFYPDELKQVLPQEGKFVFIKDNATMTLTKKVISTFNFNAF